MKVDRICKCGKKFSTYDSPSMKNKGVYCSPECMLEYRKRPSGLNYAITSKNKGWFIKGHPSMAGSAPSEITRKLWSKIRKGKRPSPKTEFKSEDVSGPRNVNWKGGITPVVNQIRHCFKYRQWRSDIFERDNYTCQECGRHGGLLRAHHIKKFSSIIEDYDIKILGEALICEELWNINNGKTLCEDCHKKIKKG